MVGWSVWHEGAACVATPQLTLATTFPKGAMNDQPMLGKEHELGNHSIRQRERTLAHFVDNSLTYDYFWTRSEVAERLRDFAFARHLQPVIVYNLRATGCGTYSVSLMHILCKRQPWKCSAVALRNWQTHLSSLFAIEIFSSRSHWCSKWESGSTSSSEVTERLPQRPWVQSRDFPVGMSRFSRCGDTRRSGYASDSRVHLRSPSMQSRQDPRVTVTKEEELKSQIQNRYVKIARSLHEKQQQLGGAK